MQRRTETKDFHPGMLDATAGGVVQADEQLLESARREAEEELGIAGVPFADHGQFYYEDKFCRVWGACSAASRMGHLRCRKKRSARCVG